MRKRGRPGPPRFGYFGGSRFGRPAHAIGAPFRTMDICSSTQTIAPSLLTVGCHLVIPHDALAEWLGVTPMRLREVSRPFPADFCFDLEVAEADAVEPGAPRGVRVFTEHGALLAGCLLNTPTTVARAVELTRACVALRRRDRRPHALALAG